MANIREFKGLRPIRDLAEKVAELPYDVISSEEARIISDKNPVSFFHITKPEVDLPSDMDVYSDNVYSKGKENLDRFIKEGTLIRDDKDNFYLYTLVMNGREQTGLVACVSIDDYINDIVKKHELTRKDKELDRMRHIDTLSAQTGLVFLLYREDGSRKDLFKQAMKVQPVYDFTAPDGIRHIFRVIGDDSIISSMRESFENTILYIADGHHRAASSVNIGLSRRKESNDDSTSEFNYFIATIFPHDELEILAYNRVIRDLNGLDREGFLKAIDSHYDCEVESIDIPKNKHNVSMYLGGSWYTLKPKFSVPEDPIKGLDVKLLQDLVMDPILGINDPRTSKRIDFIGGIKGAGELKKLVDGGEFAVAFSMYPTSVDDLIRVSDSGGIMPPKSTWFEPKLRSGLIIHEI